MQKHSIGMTWLGENKWTEIEVELPTYENQPIILIPKGLVSNILLMNSRDFYRNELLSSVQEDIMRADQSMIRILKNGNKKCVLTKKELQSREEYSFSKDLIYREIERKPGILKSYRQRKKYTKDELDE